MKREKERDSFRSVRWSAMSPHTRMNSHCRQPLSAHSYKHLTYFSYMQFLCRRILGFFFLFGFWRCLRFPYAGTLPGALPAIPGHSTPQKKSSAPPSHAHSRKRALSLLWLFFFRSPFRLHILGLLSSLPSLSFLFPLGDRGFLATLLLFPFPRRSPPPPFQLGRCGPRHSLT